MKASFFDKNGLIFKEGHYRFYTNLKPNFVENNGWYGLSDFDEEIWSGEMKMEISDIEFVK